MIQKGDWRVSRNLSARNFQLDVNVIATSASTLALTNFSQAQIIFTGNTNGQIVQLPDATTLSSGYVFYVYNEASQAISLQDNGSNSLFILLPYQETKITLQDNSTVNGTWVYSIDWELLQNTLATTDNSDQIAQLITIPSNSSALVQTEVMAVRSGGTSGAPGDSASFIRTTKLKNVGGVASVLLVQTDFTVKDQLTWNTQLIANGSNLEVHVNGDLGNNVSWTISTRVQLLSF